MKISKYIHSCLLFELEGYKLLFDPGNMTFGEGLVKPGELAGAHAMVITHIHPDHYYPENIKKILAVNDMPIFAPEEVCKALDKEGVKCTVWHAGTRYLGPFKLQVLEIVHEPLLDAPTPQMLGFVINDRILHPVDSLDEKLTRYENIELLIMITMAPFANEVKIAAFADKLKPKQVLPVHDGYCKEFFLKQRYANYANHFKKQGITFHNIYQPRESVEV